MSDLSPMLNRPGAITDVGTGTGDKFVMVGRTDGILRVDIGLAAVVRVECGPSAVLRTISAIIIIIIIIVLSIGATHAQNFVLVSMFHNTA
jgi:D-alanyl-lipoteichoic acid acyltransferase DltB (MBOAT superfamily)